jgi:hypothetical protein
MGTPKHIRNWARAFRKATRCPTLWDTFEKRVGTILGLVCLGTVWEGLLELVWDVNLWECVWEQFWESYGKLNFWDMFWAMFGMCLPYSFGTWNLWENVWEPLGCLWEGFGIFLFLLVGLVV